MATEGTVDMEKRLHNEYEEWYPKYFVSQPPHRDTLEPVYYKVVSPNGPVFWRHEGDDYSQETTMMDLFHEDRGGFGITELDKEYTPWANEE